MACWDENTAHQLFRTALSIMADDSNSDTGSDTPSRQGTNDPSNNIPRTAARPNKCVALLLAAEFNVLYINDEGYKNAWRADGCFDATLGSMRRFAAIMLSKFWRHLVNQLVEHNGAQVKLKDLPLCSQHAHAPGDGKPRVRLTTLRQCPLCSHWITAMAAAHDSGNVNKLAVRHPPRLFTTMQHSAYN